MVKVQREVRRRGIVGKFFKYLFIAFNVLMALWLFSYWKGLGEGPALDEATRAGKVIGGTIGSGILIMLWALGDIILGMLTFFTRGRSEFIIEER